ncbi:hypothetical protein GUITHDRAFT_105446 [Guillardia theta CCMP2712]|uniref:EF-hand domain-containing protein n=1 Tax=Guillardia theta (strain CCMP2712) TaxID=905079 RepID=L1JL69_GUITC|nr:hypothetical protein GUITHDRAFT_105446 [Guillardia theta CCMP2712]EKX48820.1 hypothetical protein GUITHDRAFT_105446 [Guillardia theta CCMP2712]|eukprot:XP_005835800.1 hypothetical protein GUITHDRAFT_105446 [Guillardia theta CCMP2712]
MAEAVEVLANRAKMVRIGRKDEHGGNHYAGGNSFSSSKAGSAFSRISSGHESTTMIPAADEHGVIIEGILQKKIIRSTVSWQPQRVRLSSTDMVFSDIKTDEVLDSIFLHEIDHVLKAVDSEEDLKPKNTGSMLLMETREDEIIDSDDDSRTFVIKTSAEGHNLGRVYSYRTSSDPEFTNWLKSIKSAVKHAKQEHEKKVLIAEIGDSKVALFRARLKRLYQSNRYQLCLAICILFSYSMDVVEAEINPESGSYMDRALSLTDTVTSTFFCFELAINMFAKSANRFKEFYSDPWNILDFFVVTTSMLTALMPLAMSSLRVLRLIRMFEVVTTDAWASMITRSLFGPQGQVDRAVAFFFISYVLLAGLVLTNIVVAVLLDEFIAYVSREKEQIESQKEQEREAEWMEKKVTGVLDPLTHSLAHFNDNEDLTTKIRTTFDRLDVDKSGGLTFEEFKTRVRELPTASPVHLNKDDFDIITEQGALCNEDGEFSAQQFQHMMRGEMKNFAQRQMASSMEWTQSRELRSIMLMLKILGISIDTIAKQTRDTHTKQDNHQQDSLALVLKKLEGIERALQEEQEKRRRVTSAVKSIHTDIRTLCAHFSLDNSRTRPQEQEGEMRNSVPPQEAAESRKSPLAQDDELLKNFGRVFEHFEEMEENLVSISNRVDSFRMLEQRLALLEKFAASSISSPSSQVPPPDWGSPAPRPSPPANGPGRAGAGGRQRSVSLRASSTDRSYSSLLSLGDKSDTVMIKREFVSQHLVPASLTKKQLQELQVSFAPSRKVP